MRKFSVETRFSNKQKNDERVCVCILYVLSVMFEPMLMCTFCVKRCRILHMLSVNAGDFLKRYARQVDPFRFSSFVSVLSVRLSLEKAVSTQKLRMFYVICNRLCVLIVFNGKVRQALFNGQPAV